jgi:hypothetical protein
MEDSAMVPARELRNFRNRELGLRAQILALDAGADVITKAGHAGRLLQALWRSLADRQPSGTIKG